MPRADKLYWIPAVTGSDLLSPGSQALVACCRGKPRAEISNWACRPRLDAYAWLHGMRTHRLQQWPSRFYCDPFVPFALSGHFRSELHLLYPEILKRTHQGIVWNGRQFETQ
ncbi:hypothetical protein PIB30_080499 [Stylosanthes scabra]|uniref:Uncharacterized protein n=1 Tax=Stylosanthes scabra TaxID=79078 RepID=A0ABU6ZQ56_9FABA|nr:hypothetical protein [Stylosanthes scabra]